MLSREPQNSKLPVVCKQKIDEACNWVIKKKKKRKLSTRRNRGKLQA